MIAELRRRAIVYATLALSIAPALAAQATVARGTAAVDEPVIEVMGRGETHVAPDRATVVLSVETKGLVAAAVAAANALVQRRILDTLRALGYTGAQVSTVSYNVAPNYEPVPNANEPRQRGYTARNTVQVKVTQLDRVGAVIDAALARGANGVEGITFDVANSDVPRQAALTDAALHARADAAALAKAMGGTLGRLLGLTTQDQPGSPRFLAQAARFDRAAETPITPGDLTVDGSVVARWQFQPGP